MTADFYASLENARNTIGDDYCKDVYQLEIEAEFASAPATEVIKASQSNGFYVCPVCDTQRLTEYFIDLHIANEHKDHYSDKESLIELCADASWYAFANLP